MRSNRRIGALGGEAEPLYDGDPPAWFVRNSRYFAIGRQGEREGDVTETRGWVWGAGSIYRREALDELERAGARPVCGDRSGTKMTTGGDVELCLYLRELGWRIWYSPRLRLQHYMPRSRFARRKFYALMFQNGIFDAAVRFPLFCSGGRVKTGLVWTKHFLGRQVRRHGDLAIVPDAVQLAGQLWGLATAGPRIEVVRANRRRLRDAETRGRGRAEVDLTMGQFAT
jgi:hypothetical protein